MSKILEYLKKYPSQRDVVSVMLRYGISVREGKAYCGTIELADSSIARAANVDRRVVRSTIERIMDDPELSDYFSRLDSIALLAGVAPLIGCNAIEIIPVDANMPGILAEITHVIYEAGVSVRQAVVDEMTGNPRLIVVIEGQLPPEILPRLKACQGVSSIILR